MEPNIDPRDAESLRMRFLDWRNKGLAQLGSGQWITVYSHARTSDESAGLYSGLVPLRDLDTVMEDHCWDIMIGSGHPGCVVSGFGGENQEVRYYRLGDGPVEPIVVYREFHGAVPDYVEVSEEFRLFHRLCWDRKRDVYVAFDESGDPEDVITIKPDRVEIRSKYLKQYLAIRDMALLLYFDLDRYSTFGLSDLQLDPKQSESAKEPEIRYDMYSGPFDFSGRRSFTQLLGKKVIRGFSKQECGIWPYEPVRQYADFLIQRERGGEPEAWNADHNRLANYFGANSEAPHYLTPVFFRREVLNKYYANPERYSVEDGYLRASGRWGLQMDNNHAECVVVFLGDLGRDLPYKEQLYWKTFNVEPAGSMSEVYFRRSILGQFTGPSRPDLLFKQALEQFSKDFLRLFGWPLFKPVSTGDEHFLTALRIPLSETQAEFDSQVLAISKCLIDSINEGELVKVISLQDPAPKGIGKLELFLGVHGVNGGEDHIRFLRNLWNLRHGAGHRKGESYTKAARFFKLEEQGFILAFEGVLRQAIDLLQFLRKALVPTPD
jgi:hypothetical protein